MKKLYNITLCYHGITENKNNTSEYVTYVEDFKGQIKYILSLGYRIVFPSEFYGWYKGELDFKEPICAITFDDGLESILLVTDWLIENKYNFGVSIIASRLRENIAEEGYLNWYNITEFKNSKCCELMSHSYNLHNFLLGKRNGTVESVPVLELPAYTDNGFNMYLSEDDIRPYFDLSLIDRALAFSLIGTDIKTNKAIVATVEFVSPKTFWGKLLRLWACLSSPPSSGYDAYIKITINNDTVYDGKFKATQDDEKSQWVQRNFTTIIFNKGFEFEKGKRYSIRFETKNIGNGAFRIYAISSKKNNMILNTNFTKGDELSNLNPCLIIGDGSGSSWSMDEYSKYIDSDCKSFRESTTKYLNLKDAGREITQYSYPYGAYLMAKDDEISPVLTNVLKGNNFIGGWTIYPSRIYRDNNLIDEQVQINPYTIPRVSVYGNKINEVIINNIGAYTGELFPEFKKGNIKYEMFVPNYGELVGSELLDIIVLKDIENYKKSYNKSTLIFKDLEINNANNQDIKNEIKAGYDGINVNCDGNMELRGIKTISNKLKKYNKKLQLTIIIPVKAGKISDFSFIRFFNISDICYTLNFKFKFIDNKVNNLSNIVDEFLKVVDNLATKAEKSKVIIGYNSKCILSEKNRSEEVSLNRSIVKAIKTGIKIEKASNDYFYKNENVECYMATTLGLNNLTAKAESHGLWGISIY